MIACTFDTTFFFFSALYITNNVLTIWISYAFYMLNYPACLLAVRNTVCGCKHARNCVYLKKRSEIVPTIKNLYHIQCQCGDELSSLKKKNHILSLTRSRPRIDPGFYALAFESAAVFFIMTNIVHLCWLFLDNHFLS